MTTIAYRGGMLASDSLATRNGMVAGACEKIFRLKDRSLVGLTGDMNYIPTVVAHMNGEADLPAYPTTADCPTVIRIMPNGTVMIAEMPNLGFFECDASFHAIGSGQAFAVAAMHMGADARLAVEIAIRCDVWSGGGVVAMLLKTSRASVMTRKPSSAM